MKNLVLICFGGLGLMSHLNGYSQPIPPSEVSYITTNCPAHDLDCLNKVDEKGISSINYGMIFINSNVKDSNGNVACTFENLSDNIGGEGNENPITRQIWVDGEYRDTIDVLKEYQDEGNTIGLTFGGDISAGASVVDPLDDNQCQGNALYKTISGGIEFLKEGGVIVKRIDFDIESNRFKDGKYNAEYYKKIQSLITDLKAKYNVEIVFTLPQYSTYWAKGYNEALKDFIANNKNNFDYVTFMLGSNSGNTPSLDLEISRCNLSGFSSNIKNNLCAADHALETSKVSALINAKRNEQEGFKTNYEKLENFSNGTKAAGYLGVQFWGMINMSNAQIDQEILSEYYVVNNLSQYKKNHTEVYINRHGF